MGNILKDNNGNVIISGNKAFEVTASVDSNIVPGNIKKDVSILGVTGTYEGSGGGGSDITLDLSTGTSNTNNWYLTSSSTWSAASTNIGSAVDVTSHRGKVFKFTRVLSQDCRFAWLKSLDGVNVNGAPGDFCEDTFLYYYSANSGQPTYMGIVPNDASYFYCATKINGVNATVGLIISGSNEHNHLYAFFCDMLPSVTLPSGLTRVRYGLFYNQINLVTVVIPEGVKRIESYAFYGCNNLRNITIPEGVTVIDGNAFRMCYWIQNLTLPSTLTTFGNDVFNNCLRLQSIVIPSGVTVIPSGLLYGCTALTYLDIPSTVTEFKGTNLHLCTSLKTIICRATTPPIVVNGTFGNGTASYTGRNTYNQGVNKLYVPQGCSSAYNTSYWASVLLDSTKCGFTIAELDANGNIPT